MTAELDFTEDRAAKIEYVMDRIQEARNGDFTAGNYCLYLMDSYEELYNEAADALIALEAYYLGS